MKLTFSLFIIFTNMTPTLTSRMSWTCFRALWPIWKPFQKSLITLVLSTHWHTRIVSNVLDILPVHVNATCNMCVNVFLTVLHLAWSLSVPRITVIHKVLVCILLAFCQSLSRRALRTLSRLMFAPFPTYRDFSISPFPSHTYLYLVHAFRKLFLPSALQDTIYNWVFPNTYLTCAQFQSLIYKYFQFVRLTNLHRIYQFPKPWWKENFANVWCLSALMKTHH